MFLMETVITHAYVRYFVGVAGRDVSRAPRYFACRNPRVSQRIRQLETNWEGGTMIAADGQFD